MGDSGLFKAVFVQQGGCALCSLSFSNLGDEFLQDWNSLAFAARLFAVSGLEHLSQSNVNVQHAAADVAAAK